jgi:hypothetical protein
MKLTVEQLTLFIDSCKCKNIDDIKKCNVCNGWICGSDEWIQISKYSRQSKYTKKFQSLEKSWGLNVLKIFKLKTNIETNQWTNYLCEELLDIYLPDKLIRKNNKINKPKINKFILDCENKNYVFECKCRTYTTNGTIGEKLIGCAYKYSDIPTIYNKKLYIVLFGYQEYESSNTKLNILNVNSNKKLKIINLLKEFDIYFIPFSSFIS